MCSIPQNISYPPEPFLGGSLHHKPCTLLPQYVVAKTIRDGVIDATIDYSNGWVVFTERTDVYNTPEPTKEFNKRIQFCNDTHNQAIR